MTVRDMLYNDLFSVRMGLLERHEDVDAIDGVMRKVRTPQVPLDELVRDLIEADLRHFAQLLDTGVYANMISSPVNLEVYQERLEQHETSDNPIESSVQPVIEPHAETPSTTVVDLRPLPLVKPMYDGFGFPRGSKQRFEELAQTAEAKELNEAIEEALEDTVQ